MTAVSSRESAPRALFKNLIGDAPSKSHRHARYVGYATVLYEMQTPLIHVGVSRRVSAFTLSQFLLPKMRLPDDTLRHARRRPRSLRRSQSLSEGYGCAPGVSSSERRTSPRPAHRPVVRGREAGVLNHPFGWNGGETRLRNFQLRSHGQVAQWPVPWCLLRLRAGWPRGRRLEQPIERTRGSDEGQGLASALHRS